MRTFFAAKIRVQLFSKPQHTVANITNIAPQEKANEVISSNGKTKLDNVINNIASHIFLKWFL